MYKCFNIDLQALCVHLSAHSLHIGNYSLMFSSSIGSSLIVVEKQCIVVNCRFFGNLLQSSEELDLGGR